MTNDYNSANELFKLSEFYYCIKENAKKENACIIKRAGGIKVTYKKGEIVTLAISKKLMLNKLELTYFLVCIIRKKIGKIDVSKTP